MLNAAQMRRWWPLFLGSEGGWRSRVGNILCMAFDGERFYIGNTSDKGLILNGFPLGEDWVLSHIQASGNTNTLTAGFVVVEFEEVEVAKQSWSSLFIALILMLVLAVFWAVLPIGFSENFRFVDDFAFTCIFNSAVYSEALRQTSCYQRY
jgi:hypothetical protein